MRLDVYLAVCGVLGIGSGILSIALWKRRKLFRVLTIGFFGVACIGAGYMGTYGTITDLLQLALLAFAVAGLMLLISERNLPVWAWGLYLLVFVLLGVGRFAVSWDGAMRDSFIRKLLQEIVYLIWPV